MGKGLLKDVKESLEEPIEIPKTAVPFFRKGKVKVTIIYEDGSAKEYYKKLKESYFFTIKHKKYFINPKAFVRLKYVTGFWFYNNPIQIFMPYQETKLKSSDLRISPLDKGARLVQTYIDSEALNAALDSKIIQSMYAKEPLKLKTIVYIGIALLVVVLLVLQLTGQVDVMGYLSGRSGG